MAHDAYTYRGGRNAKLRKPTQQNYRHAEKKITHTKGRNVHRTRSPVIRQAFMHTHDAVNDHRRTGSNI